MLLKEVPVCEQPREKALRFGIDKLSNIELLAILLRTGVKEESVLELSKSIIYMIEDMSDLKEISLEELTKIKGIGKTKAITILSAIELGKRVNESNKKKLRLINPEEIYKYFSPKLKDLKQEVLNVIYYDLKGNVIAIKELTKGNINNTILDASMIFKWAFKLSSNQFVIVHNHPTGDTKPSKEDIKTTIDLMEKAEVLKLTLLDHLIIGDGYFSMRTSIPEFKYF